MENRLKKEVYKKAQSLKDICKNIYSKTYYMKEVLSMKIGTNKRD
jgi:hypothetical protein